MEFSKNLKLIRKEKGFTQKEIAERLGVSQPSYAQYENGKRKPKVETVQKIADALDVDSRDLLSGFVFDQINGILEGLNADEETEQPLEMYEMHCLDENYIISLIQQLNLDGQIRLISHIEDLAKIPEYQAPAPAAASNQEGSKEK